MIVRRSASTWAKGEDCNDIQRRTRDDRLRFAGTIMRKAGTITRVMLLIAVLFLFKACDNGGGDGNGGGNVSFRLAFAVSVDGALKTGSGIIDVLFYGGGGTKSGSPYRYYTRTEGVAPVIDLGSHGWLVAAMEYDGEEYYRRKRRYGLACAAPRMAPSLLDAFGLKVSDLTKRSGGKRVLAENYYPAFIWFPAGKPYEQAQQLCPEEFSSVIGAGIKLQSVTIELAPDGPLLKRLDIRAPWLDEIRIDQRQSFTRFGTDFKPNRQAQLETDAGLPAGAQNSQQLTPFLVDLPGWAANKADGMATPEPGGNKVTRATRTYKRGSAKIDAGVVIGDRVQGTLLIMQNFMKNEIPGLRMSKSPVDGFTVLRTFATKDNVSTIMVAFSSNAAFSFVSTGIPEDEAFRLARRFDWRGMQAALPK
jgi:hypothetical protein